MIPQGLLSVVPQLKKQMPIQEEKVDVIEENVNGEGESEDGGATEQNKKDWNVYLSWLDSKKMKGKPELDKGQLGNKLFQQFLKENPNTSLTKEIIPKIRKSYMELREATINDILSGKSSYYGKSGKGTDVSSLMRHIVENEKSKDPNYVGQHLTQTFFPPAKLTTDDGMKKTIERVEIRTPKTTEQLFKIKQ